MRVDPIDPSELREWLIREMHGLRERAEQNRHNTKLVAAFMAARTQCDNIRREFLGDASSANEPTAAVAQSSATK